MSHVTSWKEGEGDFLLVVTGSTRFAPYLSGWQKFKDHIRGVVREQSGWVDVYQSQCSGEMQGWCRLKDQEDAETAYSKRHSVSLILWGLRIDHLLETFFRSKGILVHVWQTRRSSDGLRLVECNCSVHFPGLTDGQHSAGLCGVDIGRANQLGGKPYVAAPPQCRAVPQGYSYPVYPATISYAMQPINATGMHQMQTMQPMQPMAVQPPVYSASNSGMPVNIRDGAVLTESRGIFIQNLSYKVGSDELKSILYTVGRPVGCKVHRHRSGVSKGVATAEFASTHEAQLAVTHLNRKQHEGMTLKVRLDQNKTVVGQVGPPLMLDRLVGAHR
jgi:hypothetical protein